MEKYLQKITAFFEMAVDYGVCIYMLLILVVMPFYFTEGYSHIGTDKALFFRTVNVNMGRVLLYLAVILIVLELICRIQKKAEKEKGQKGKRIFGQLQLTDVFMIIYGVSLILSYRLSDYRETALLGAKGWFMGLFTQMAFVLIYFFVSRLWKPRKWMLYLVLPVSAVVFLLGYLDRFGIHLLNMESRTEAFISTIGNMNWYCGYAVSVFFLGVVLLWKEDFSKSWQRVLLMGYTALGFATLLTQGSESGAVAVGVGMLVLFCLSAGNGRKMLLFWQIMTLFSCACLVNVLLRIAVGDKFVSVNGKILELAVSWPFFAIVTTVSVVMLIWVWKKETAGSYREKGFRLFAAALVSVCAGVVVLVLTLAAVNTIYPGSIGKLSQYSLFTFSRSWGSSRGATWGAAWMCFGEQNLLHKLVGVGPDAMSAYMYSDGSEELRAFLKECFGTATLTNAHNEWLTVMSDLGILGLIGFAGTMVSAMVRFLRKGRQDTLLCAIGFCLLAYTVNNLFSFQQTMNGATIYALLGMGAAFDRERGID